MIENVWNALNTKVQGMTSITGSFNYETGLPSGSPFAIITPLTGGSEFGDSAGSLSGRNLQTHTFQIRIYQERESTTFGSADSERIIIQAGDELLDALYNDTTLSGTVKYQRPIDWEFGYEQREFTARYVQVNVEALEIVNAK